MFIERDAKRYIYRGIELDQELKSYEILERIKGNTLINNAAYETIRKELVEIFCKINSVANYEGKGRDDLGVEILLAAESVLREDRSVAVKRLALRIRESFSRFRGTFRKYEQCVELIDPQLRNNRDLVQSLLSFEDSWTKGKFFFLNPNITNLLMEFSHEVELLGMRYADVKEKMESMDADVFLTIPCMAILNSLKLKDERIYIFCDKPLDRLFEELKEKTKTISDKGYSIIERGLLEKESDERGMKEANLTKEQLDELINEIKRAAMVLQRSKPADWNLFIETAMDVF
eukprot:TRINITY_DN2800_c0_g1_i6.p1 TRINITY_DN2800_c0_g1~~TRINITY_DN2800_c0_g1_i6.p1  ORF type:complete len:290 (+),score=100.41 TRINITY_DN2800_c0_g1_i6:655-1524(+)